MGIFQRGRYPATFWLQGSRYHPTDSSSRSGRVLLHPQNDLFGDGLKKESRRACEDAAALLGPPVPHLGILMSLRSKTGQKNAEVIYPFVKTTDRETRQSNKPKGPPRVILTSRAK
ncbi:hypothetical protein SI65_00159 [Aspergillus cristatus]|uniref:Uncharacterized protein n=1 Tax=Aspergillus cristatus TaxID=573508 RepID=A0A1E3BNM5_ASPCR|nr:hypothetical protein SI65_00159 [Aspergillus cristatus]